MSDERGVRTKSRMTATARGRKKKTDDNRGRGRRETDPKKDIKAYK